MNNERNKRIEEILNSLDDHPKATAPAFLYTRLKARLEAVETAPAQRSWLLRPAFAVTALVTVLLINAIVLFQRSNTSTVSITAESDGIQSIAAEYRLNDNSAALFETNQDK